MKISNKTKEKLKNNMIKLLNENLYIDIKNQMVYNEYNQKISFKNMDIIIQKYKNVNVINKPIWISLYTKLKNNNLKEITFNKIFNKKEMLKEIRTYKEIFKTGV